MLKKFQTEIVFPEKINFLLCFLFLLYIAFRLNIGITYDEHFTLTSFVPNSFKDLVLCKPCDANHHILNTVLVKYFTLVFGDSIWIARLPNFLFAILYAFSAVKICHQFKSYLIGLFVLVALLFNPFLIEFFSLSRGYGISFALLLFSYYKTIEYWKNPKTLNLLLALTAACFTAYGNFSTLHFTASIFFIVVLKWILNRKVDKLLHIVIMLFISLVFLALFYPPIASLLAQGHLYYGGQIGFISNTLLSVAAYSSGFAFEHNSAWPVLIIALVLYFSFAIIGFTQSKKAKHLYAIPHLILVSCIVSIVAQHYILHTLWLIDRTALFLYPLFIISFGTFLQDATIRETKVKRAFSVILISLFATNFFLQFNLYKTIEWQHDSRSSEVATLLKKKANQTQEQIFLDASWPIQRSLEYYAQLDIHKNFEVLDLYNSRDSIHPKATHYLFYDRALAHVGYWQSAQSLSNKIKDTLLVYPDEKLYLFSLKSKK